MVAIPKPHRLEWRMPAPLWPKLSSEEYSRFGEPQVLRFASDGFMDQLKTILADDPGALESLILQQETWSDEKVGWQALTDRQAGVPRLYQPAHNRFYLATASLVCHRPGLPEHTIQRRKGERVSFVMRRLVPRDQATPVDPYRAETYFEYGWVPGTASKPAKGKLQPLPGGRGTFQPTKATAVPEPDKAMWKLASESALVDGEEQLPLFPMPFQGELHPRTLWAGFVPVTSRETYQAAAETSPLVQPGSEGEADPRPAQFETRVVTTLEGLEGSGSEPEEVQREVTAFLLLDWAEWLNRWANPVWKALQAGSKQGLNTSEGLLYDDLQLEVSPEETLADWLLAADAARPTILQGDLSAYDWNLTPVEFNRTVLTQTHLNALPTWDSVTDKTVFTEEQTPTLPKYTPGDIYIIRFVFEREGCPFQPILLSGATQPFTLATFFEPDAPARSVRIVMPTDTSIAGLRKFKKSVSFVVSDKLRQQMERFSGITLKELDEKKIAAATPFDFGKICSFSIPIITICAMILLLVIVYVLNFVFWWIPFLKICFPIRLKAKEG